VTVTLLLKLAWRNVRRQRRRSLLTILAVTFAAFLSITMRGMQIGSYEANIRNVVRLYSGHCQIQARGYHKNPSLESNFACDEQLLSAVRSVPHVRAVSPRITAEGLIACGGNSVGVMILGVDVRSERDVTTLLERVREGSPPSGGPKPTVVLGQTLARNLGVAIGTSVVLLAQGVDGTLGNMRYDVSGIVRTGSPDLDRTIVMMDLGPMQELLVMDGRVSALVVALDDLDHVSTAVGRLREQLPASGFEVLPWDELMPEFRQHIQMDNVSGILFLGILIVIVAFGILNTIMMSVTERYREFGVTLAMGIPPAHLACVILLEGICIGCAGLVVGNVLALGVNAYLTFHPIVFGGDLGSISEEYGFLPALYSTLRWTVFANSSLSILAVTLLSCVYPAYRVYQLQPIEGIHHA